VQEFGMSVFCLDVDTGPTRTTHFAGNGHAYIMALTQARLLPARPVTISFSTSQCCSTINRLTSF